MISAPKSPSICVQEGPASTRLRSRTVMPSSGPEVIESCPRSWLSCRHCIGWPRVSEPAQEFFSNLLPDAPKDSKPRLISASCARRVVEAPVKTPRGARKHRARLIGGVAHRDDPVPSITKKPLQRFRRVTTEIYTDLGHRAYRQRVHSRGLCAGACCFVAITSHRTQPGLSHLAPR